MSSHHSTQLPTASADVFHKLSGLQTDLVDLAYELERQGRVDAADVAVTTAARVGELCAELAPVRPVS